MSDPSYEGEGVSSAPWINPGWAWQDGLDSRKPWAGRSQGQVTLIGPMGENYGLVAVRDKQTGYPDWPHRDQLFPSDDELHAPKDQQAKRPVWKF